MATKRKYLWISVVILLVLGIFAYGVLNVSHDVLQLKQTALQTIKNDQLKSIKALIKENYDKAELQAESVKSNAEQRILTQYAGNTEGLRYDLRNIGDNPVYNILQESITGKQLNTRNPDNNDMWVWVPPIGKTNDTSRNCAFEKGQPVTTEGEINKQYNKVLARTAINSIINQENKTWLFWQYLPSPEGFYTPETMEESEIDKLYYLYGYKGLQYLEFLKPSYLRQNSDITGITDLDQNGLKTNNDKIIFCQGFNIVDDLEVNHKDLLQYYDSQIENINSVYDIKYHAIIASGIFLASVLFLGFWSLVKEFNRE